MSALTNTYQEIALERPHRCSGCDGSQFLSHSHLIPRSWRKDLECVKENIVYHCLDLANGCHTRWEGRLAPVLYDFIKNMLYIYEVDKTYFHIKFYKLMDHYNSESSFTDPKQYALGKKQLELLAFHIADLKFR